MNAPLDWTDLQVESILMEGFREARLPERDDDDVDEAVAAMENEGGHT